MSDKPHTLEVGTGESTNGEKFVFISTPFHPDYMESIVSPLTGERRAAIKIQYKDLYWLIEALCKEFVAERDGIELENLLPYIGENPCDTDE